MNQDSSYEMINDKLVKRISVEVLIDLIYMDTNLSTVQRLLQMTRLALVKLTHIKLSVNIQSTLVFKTLYTRW